MSVMQRVMSEVLESQAWVEIEDASLLFFGCIL
jgi:hypothetical protein